MIADLKYLGVTHVRDSLVNPAHLAAYETVAAQGIKFTLTDAGQTQTTARLASTLSLAEALLAATPGSVQAIEGPNEINNWPVTYNGVGGLPGALELQADLYKAVHGSAALKGVAVDYFTGYAAGNVAAGPNPSVTPGLAYYDNQHPYPTRGLAPGAQVNPAVALGNEPGAAQGPSVYTETGYSTNGGVTGAVDQQVQAKYTLDLLFDAMKDGVAQTYLYDLLDGYAPGSKQGDDGFGLFDSNNMPKPVATAIHNLTTILADNGATASSFTTGGLNPTITGLPPTGDDLIFEKSDGTFDIVVWAEPQIWNMATGSEIAAPARSVTINLGQAFQNVSLYGPLTGSSPVWSATDEQTLQVNVSDHPIIIQVSGSLYSAAAIAAMSATYIAGLAARGVSEIQTGGATVAITVAQALAFAAGGIVLQGAAGAVISVADTAANLEALTPTQIQSLPSVGVTTLGPISGVVAYTAGVDNAILAAGLSASGLASSGAAVTVANGSTIQTVYGPDGAVESVTDTQTDGSSDVYVYGAGSFRGVGYTASDIAYSASRVRASVTFFDDAGNVVASKNSTPNGGLVITVGGVVITDKQVNADGSAYVADDDIAGRGYSSYDSAFSANSTLLAKSFNNVDSSGLLRIYGSNSAVSISASGNAVSDGADSFVFAGHSTETISLGNVAHDVLKFSQGFGVDSVVNLGPAGSAQNSLDLTGLFSSYQNLAAHESASGGNTVITATFGDQLTVVGTAPSALSAGRLGF